MKTILISSAISLLIGFTFGWLINSASSELDSIVTVSAPDRPSPRPSAPENAPPERNRPEPPMSDTGPQKGTPNGTADVPRTAKRADRAKWMRLIEVLGLDDDQAKALEAAMSESRPKVDDGTPPEIAYAEAGAILERSILALLEPEQRTAFLDLQRRAMENRIEVSAQQTYAQELGELDLSPDQRKQALDLLRGRAEEIASDIPASTRLLLTGSILPIGDERFTEDAIRLLRQLSPQETGDVTLDKLAGKRRAEAEEKAALLGDVLTPAQLELYRSGLSQTPDILERIRAGE